MADLRELATAQRWLASLILAPELLDRDSKAATEPITIEDPDLCVERLLAYVNGYPARIFEALGEAFPAIKHIVGDHRFADLTNRYRPCLPTAIYNLSDIGANLPEFLRTDVLGEEFELLGDLAQLEWRIQCAFHSRERDPFDMSRLANWTMEDWSRASLEFQPSVAVVQSAWPILDVWEARETPLEDIDIDLRERPQNVLVYRSGLHVRCETIANADALAFEVLTSGLGLGDAMERLSEEDSAPETVMALFAQLTRNGLVTGCSTATP